MSPVIFNAVFEDCLRKLKPAWRDKGYGLMLGDGLQNRLTNLRFADDILVLATSKRHLGHMVEDWIDEAGRAGLEIHTGKTKVLTNQAPRKGTMQVGFRCLEVLAPSDSADYL
eukprot:1552751-Karenia_brevis.AAC.1